MIIILLFNKYVLYQYLLCSHCISVATLPRVRRGDILRRCQPSGDELDYRLDSCITPASSSGELSSFLPYRLPPEGPPLDF